MGEIEEKSPLLLIVDDDAALRLLARVSLEEAGYEVREASGGSEAIFSFTQVQPDLILLDAMMPDMDGFEVCEAVRRLPEGADIPIMLMTGLDDTGSINRAYEIGVTDFITKPINWHLLTYRVRYILRASLANKELQKSKARLVHAHRIAQLGYWDWDLKANTFQWSDELCRAFQIKDTKSVQASFLDFVHPDDLPYVRGTLKQMLVSREPSTIEYRILLMDGSIRFVHQHAEVTVDETGKPVYLSGTIQDISERKHAEEQITFLAYYDSLTKLPNRTLFKKLVSQALAYAQRYNQILAILFLDLDLFKRFNDTLGHSMGDQLLKAVADRLLGCIRTSDLVARASLDDFSSSVARLGGDEFTVLLSNIKEATDAARVARRLLSLFSEPFKVESHEVFVTASIGISLYPADGQDMEALLKNADTAMYHAKSLGRNNYQFFRQSMNSAAFERLTLENSLRKALERKEFTLFYQPKFKTDSRRIVGVEALLRWQHPDLGMILPSEFIHLAEETGLIVQIGEWVLHTACTQCKSWQDAGAPPFRVAVNISSVQFRNPARLIETVKEALQRSGLDPKHLELELTESLLMENEEQSIATLGELRDLGIKISIDDFGTGYSSLSYLKSFPLDEMKIDKSFLRDVPGDTNNAAIATAIIVMAHTLNLKAIAEGVETEQQLEFLRERGCDAIQGFLLGKPMDQEELAKSLNLSLPPSGMA